MGRSGERGVGSVASLKAQQPHEASVAMLGVAVLLVNGNRNFPICGNSNFPTLLGIGAVGRTQEPGLELLFKAVGIAPDVEGHGVVKQAIEDRGGDHAVTEDFPPGAEALVAGQDHGSTLVATADELEEQVGSLPIDGQVADLIDDQQPRRCLELELVVELALGHGLGQRSDQVRGRGKQHPVAGLDGLQAQGHGHVRLAHAGRPQDDHVVPMFDEVAARQVNDLRSGSANSDTGIKGDGLAQLGEYFAHTRRADRQTRPLI